MARYAAQTTVPVSRTRAEIERTLERYGAEKFMAGWTNDGSAMLGFQMRGKTVRFLMPPPDSSPRVSEKKRQQEERSSWRALLLLVKAKLEAVESGFTVFEEEFMPYIVTSTGETVYEHFREQLQNQNATPLMLPATL